MINYENAPAGIKDYIFFLSIRHTTHNLVLVQTVDSYEQAELLKIYITRTNKNIKSIDIEVDIVPWD